jgi:nucleoside recognition membrane protein YjiH
MTSKLTTWIKFIGFSTIGIFLFFVPITISGASSIPIDHVVTYVKNTFPHMTRYYAIGLVYLGAILPFYEKSWNKNTINRVLTCLKWLGALFATMFLLQIGPSFLLEERMIPFLFTRISYSVAIVIPIGATLLTFIIDYGLLEFLGVLMKPIMRPIWKIPGSASVTAVASFIGSFSVGIFMANRLYLEGRYTKKEATLVMTGFSTVSASFMVIVARTLDLMDSWLLFFFVSLMITFITSAIVTRLYPLNKVPDTYYNNMNAADDESIRDGNFLKTATQDALLTAAQAPPIIPSLVSNFNNGLILAMRLLPLMISIGTLAFYLIYNTPVFDWIGYLYYPLLKILGVTDALLVSKAAALAGAEMFIPSAIVAGAGASLMARFITGIVSIASIIFFAGTIPVILATDIDLSIQDLLIILIERTFVILILSVLAFNLIY